MNAPEAICKLAQTLSITKYEKDREYIKGTIDILKKYLEAYNGYKKLEERVKELESKVSFLKK